jgi:hypothetical protein
MSVTSLTGLRASYVNAQARRVPPDIMAAVRAEAEASDMAVTDTALRALGDYYGQDVITTGRPYRASRASTDIVDLAMVVPEQVKYAIWRQAREKMTTESAIIIGILGQRYGIGYLAPKRGRPRKGTE